MRSPPKFLSGAFRTAMRVALHEIFTGAERHDEAAQCRGWKLFMLLLYCCSGFPGVATFPNSSFWNGSALSLPGSGTSC